MMTKWTVVVRNATTNDVIHTETVETKYLADQIADDWFNQDENCYVRVSKNENSEGWDAGAYARFTLYCLASARQRYKMGYRIYRKARNSATRNQLRRWELKIYDSLSYSMVEHYRNIFRGR